MIPVWVVLLVVAATVLLWRLPSPCGCEKCAFHVHERAQRRLQKLEREHDTAHKGYGFKAGAPDLFACSERDCARNPAVKP